MIAQSAPATLAWATAIVLAVPAHADGAFNSYLGDHDAYAFSVDIRPPGVDPSDPNFVTSASSLASTTCNSLRNGMSESQAIATMGPSDPSMVQVDTFIVHAAEYHFCPNFIAGDGP
jgi:hypothetical protein